MAAALAQAQAEIQAFLTSLNFTPAQTTAVIEQGITSLDILKETSDAEIHDACVIIRRLTRTNPNNAAVFLLPVPMTITNERVLKCAAYYIRHLDRTQRAFVPAFATIARLNEMQVLKDEEKEAKEKKPTPLTKLESVAKIRVAIENINDHLLKLRGSNGVPLTYIIREHAIPLPAAQYPDDITEMIGRAPHAGRFYRGDNEAVWNVLRTVLYDSDGWSWVTAFEATKDGRGAYFALMQHYLGTSHQSLIKTTADANVENTYYDGDKRGFTFEKYCQIHKQAHKDLADFGEPMSEDKKVRKFLQGIRAQHLAQAKLTVLATHEYRSNFDNAVNFIASLTNTASLMSNTRRNISSVEHKQKGRGDKGGRGGRAGRGRGRGDGRGGGGRGGRGGGGYHGRGGRGTGGGRGSGGDITDRYYPYEEWTSLTSEQQQKVRDIRNDRDLKRGVGALGTSDAGTGKDDTTNTTAGVGQAMSQRNQTRNS